MSNLTENGWHVIAKHRPWGNEYKIMDGDVCCGRFKTLDELRSYRLLLMDDLEVNGDRVSREARAEYNQMIAAIEKTLMEEVCR